MKAQTYKTLSQLTKEQRNHLAWRLDHKTSCGLVTACIVARGEHGDLNIVDIFETYGCITRHAAKLHATKVQSFTLHKY